LAEILPSFAASLALTATPEIEAYPERTEKLLALCGGNVFSYTIENAIKAGVLCPYYYYPRPVFLSPEVSHKYLEILHNLDGAEANKTLELYREKRELLRKSGLYVAELDRLLGELTASDESSLELTVVYSPPGYDHDSDTRIIERVKGEFEKRRLATGVIVGGTPRAARQTTLSAFRNGTFPILLGIGCLDEGLDIPETRRSIILYSFDRKKQFIQRRGRVLRTAPGKEAAEIYDLILLPRGAELSESEAERILERELRRYREFAEGALNPDEASAVLDNALQTN
jgi:superfamily II DNA or RNA helicase